MTVLSSARLTLVAVAAALLAACAPAPEGTRSEIAERIAPVGGVDSSAMEMVAAAPAVPAAPRSGEAVYSTYCVACHMSGAAGAPKYGDATAWAPRIAKGKDALYASTYNGLNGVMPARGTCMDCSDEELQATVDYMVAAAE
jgi:cytochrome c5